MNLCPHCGAQQPDGASICSVCGGTITSQANQYNNQYYSQNQFMQNTNTSGNYSDSMYHNQDYYASSYGDPDYSLDSYSYQNYSEQSYNGFNYSDQSYQNQNYSNQAYMNQGYNQPYMQGSYQQFAAYPSNDEPKKKSKKGLFIGIGIGMVVVIGLILFFVLSKKDNDSSTSKKENASLISSGSLTGEEDFSITESQIEDEYESYETYGYYDGFIDDDNSQDIYTPEIADNSFYTDPIENYLNGFAYGNSKMLYAAFPEAIVEKQITDSGLDSETFYSEMDDSLSIYTTVFAGMTYTYGDISELSDEECKKYETTLYNNYGYSCTVTEGYCIDVSLEMYGENDESSMNVYYIDGKWSLDIEYMGF